MDKNIIIEMTPFIFEDGKTYYFQIHKWSSNDYHALCVYQKKVRKIFFWEFASYKQIGKLELIKTSLDVYEIKSDIKKILTSLRAHDQIKDWDGVVGDIPDEVKKSLKRDSKLNDLFK